MSNYFFKSHQKTSDKNEETGRRKSYELKNGKLKKKKEKKVLCNKVLKGWAINFSQFSFFDCKGQLPHGILYEDKKMHNSVVSKFFPMPKTSLSASIIKTDML